MALSLRGINYEITNLKRLRKNLFVAGYFDEARFIDEIIGLFKERFIGVFSRAFDKY